MLAAAVLAGCSGTPDRSSATSSSSATTSNSTEVNGEYEHCLSSEQYKFQGKWLLSKEEECIYLVHDDIRLIVRLMDSFDLGPGIDIKLLKEEDLVVQEQWEKCLRKASSSNCLTELIETLCDTSNSSGHMVWDPPDVIFCGKCVSGECMDKKSKMLYELLLEPHHPYGSFSEEISFSMRDKEVYITVDGSRAYIEIGE